MKTAEEMYPYLPNEENDIAIREYNQLMYGRREAYNEGVKAMQSSTSQPMSAEPTVQQLREASKNNPDTFLAGALYVIDNYKLNSPLMSAEQYSSGAMTKLDLSMVLWQFKEGKKSHTDCLTAVDAYTDAIIAATAPTVKAEGWVSVEDKLPEVLETVWVSNGKGWTALGCRTDYYENDEGGFDWCWAGSNGIIYEESGKIVSECEEDDLDVRFWHPLPEPPATK